MNIILSCISYRDVDTKSTPITHSSLSLGHLLQHQLRYIEGMGLKTARMVLATFKLSTFRIWVCYEVSKNCKNENTEKLKMTDRTKWKHFLS